MPARGLGRGDDMTGALLYGNSVVTLTRRLRAVDRTALIIRHSERPSFDNLPIESWDSVGLTERGVEAARDLGEGACSGGRDPYPRRLRLGAQTMRRHG